MKQRLYYLAIIVFSILFLILVPKTFKYNHAESGEDKFYLAKVIEIQLDKDVSFEGYAERQIKFVAEISFGFDKGSQKVCTQGISDDFAFRSTPVKVGDSVIITKIEGDEHFSFVAKSRLSVMIIMIVLFIALILVIGRRQGVLTIITLSFTTLSLFLILIPAILSSVNVYLITSVVVVFIIISSISLLAGLGKKSITAISGNILGVVLAAALAIIFNKLLGITGIVDEDYLFLFMQQDSVKIDLIAVVWSSIIIGSLGAVMDVAISISSALEELANEMESPKPSKLIKAGMNIGRDIIGTMTNTLILAYVGSSLAVLLLFALYNRSLLFLFNMEMIVVEISQAIIGSIAVIITVPTTVLVAAMIYGKKK